MYVFFLGIYDDDPEIVTLSYNDFGEHYHFILLLCMIKYLMKFKFYETFSI